MALLIHRGRIVAVQPVEKLREKLDKYQGAVIRYTKSDIDSTEITKKQEVKDEPRTESTDQVVVALKNIFNRLIDIAEKALETSTYAIPYFDPGYWRTMQHAEDTYQLLKFYTRH